MPIIDHIDGANRDIYLHSDTVGASVHPIDIYKEMRTLRRTNETLQVFTLFLEAKGNEDKGGGSATERYVVCKDGTRIIPYNVSHTLTVTGTIITDDGQSGIACFDRSPLSASTVVDINYEPPQVEVITVSSGSGLSTEEHNKLMALPSAVSIAAAVWDFVVETTYSASNLLRLFAAVLTGKVSGAGTGTETFKGLDDSTDRVISTVDDDGNRTQVTRNVS